METIAPMPVTQQVPCTPAPKVYHGIVILHRVKFAMTPDGELGICQDCGHVVITCIPINSNPAK